MTEDQATIDGFPKYGLLANHFNMHKYWSRDDANYATVMPQLRKMIIDAPGRAHARLHREVHS